MAKKFSFDKLTGDSKKEVKKKEEEPKKEYKMLRIKFETHHQLKVQASKLGLSILDYVDLLVNEKNSQ